jgi:hypothetical protein
MNRRRWAYAALLVLAAVAAALALVSTGKSNPPFPLSTVTPSQIAVGGVALGPASGPPPAAAVGLSVAAQRASAMAGGPAREVHYVGCVDAFVRPQIDEDCYAVSVDPSATPVMSSPYQQATPEPKWEIVFVDPSGQVLNATGGSNS